MHAAGVLCNRKQGVALNTPHIDKYAFHFATTTATVAATATTTTTTTTTSHHHHLRTGT